MNVSLNSIKKAYFIGIGGVSMSSLASILLKKGIEVYGYDMKESPLTQSLTNDGAVVSYDLNSDIPSGIDAVIYSAAIKDDNPIMIKARMSGASILSRAELIGAIASSFNTSIGVAGTHGKSTTTGFLSSICLCFDSETTVLSGANLPFLNSFYKYGSGERIVYEACEYKNSYHSMIPDIKVILNCEHDHVDFFPTIEDVKKSFQTFVSSSRTEGGTNIAVINRDCKNCVEIANKVASDIFYYSISESADFEALDIDMSSGYGVFTLKLNDGCIIRDIHLSVPGIHNVSNAVAAAAAAYLSGVSGECIKSGIESFTGVSRRFEFLGEYNGAKIYDDYAHHPDEIEVTLRSARNLGPKRLICVFQPHTYSRTYEMLGDFAKALSLADKVYLCDIYAAREVNTYGVNSADLARLLSGAVCAGNFETIAKSLSGELSCGDYCITMGAGEAYKVANIILDKKAP